MQKAHQLAQSIIEARDRSPLQKSSDLSKLVEKVYGFKSKKVLPQIFQALRIAVNDEFGQLADGLMAAERALAPGGQLAVVTFHSLEDRSVKTFMKERSGDPSKMSRRLPGEPEVATPTFTTITRKAVTAQKDELRANPRARSAKLRAVARNEQPPMTGGRK